jgi:hypothetical protein
VLGVLIHFGSRKFDITKEPENDINPIPGQSFLAWLRPRLEELGYMVEGPDTEDWGWYLEVQDAHARHMVGASAIPDDPVAWTVQVRRWRRVREWLFRTASPPQLDDPLVQTIFRFVCQIADAPDDTEETFLEMESPPAGF